VIKDYQVKQIDSHLTYDLILHKHYAQRKPSISFAFGLYCQDVLIGVCTFGKPASNSLCIGVCGKEYSKQVYELNRLILIDGINEKNILSYFVSKCLKFLKPMDLIIVSYADEGAGHCGYIYQATNFIYTGKTKERTDKYAPNGKHSRHYTTEFNYLRKVRTSKHRYIYFTGKRKKEYLKHLNYDIKDYPKVNNVRYVLGERIKTKIINKNTNEIYYE